MRNSFRRTPKRMMPLLPLVTFCLLTFAGCGISNPPFPGGVRIKTDEGIIEVPGAFLPVNKAEDFGNLVVVLGPGPGTDSVFHGFTNVVGIDDHPNAIFNARWQIVVEYDKSSAPRCPPFGPVNRDGGPGGLIQTVHCILI